MQREIGTSINYAYLLSEVYCICELYVGEVVIYEKLDDFLYHIACNHTYENGEMVRQLSHERRNPTFQSSF